MNHGRCNPGPGIVVWLAFRYSAGQGLGLGDNGWYNCIGVLCDRAKSLSFSCGDLFGRFLAYRQLVNTTRVNEDLLL